MKIPLPKNYSYKDIADVYDGILYIHRLASFRALMFDITYATYKKELECAYCGEKLERKSATLDHIYPEHLGGPYIPENLCVACDNCNCLKKDMLLEDFYYFLTLNESSKLKFQKNYKDHTIYSLKKLAPVIPRQWYVDMPVSEIGIIKDSRKGTKDYLKSKAFYEEFHRIPYPVIVDMEYNLLDGYSCAILARENGLEKVPTIVLENVILEF